MLLPSEKIRKSILESIPPQIKTRGDNADSIKSGTTAFAFYYHGGVIVAADTRLTCDSSIFRHDFRKVWEIDKDSLLTASGTLAHIQEVANQLVRLTQKFKIESDGKDLSFDGKTRLLREVIRVISASAEIESDFIMAGYDRKTGEFKICEFDQAGGMYPVSKELGCATVGMGGDTADTVIRLCLDSRKKMDVCLAIKTAIRAFAESARRNAESEPPSLHRPTIFKISKAGWEIIENSPIIRRHGNG